MSLTGRVVARFRRAKLRWTGKVSLIFAAPFGVVAGSQVVSEYFGWEQAFDVGVRFWALVAGVVLALVGGMLMLLTEHIDLLEPEIEISYVDKDGKETRKSREVRFDFTYSRPLTEEELTGLLSQLERHFPMPTDFDTPKPQGMALAEKVTAWKKAEYTPPKEAQIEQYSEEYVKWRHECRSVLRTLHRKLQIRDGYPTCTFLLRNVGSQPAEDVLISFEAQGRLEIARPERIAPEKKRKRAISLPMPPKPPKGRWDLVPIPLGIHDLGIHDLGIHDLGIHDLGIHDLGIHDLGIHDLGIHDLGIHDLGIHDLMSRLSDLTGPSSQMCHSRGSVRRFSIRLVRLQGIQTSSIGNQQRKSQSISSWSASSGDTASRIRWTSRSPL